jgi:hypothetical protein
VAHRVTNQTVSGDRVPNAHQFNNAMPEPYVRKVDRVWTLTARAKHYAEGKFDYLMLLPAC